MQSTWCKRIWVLLPIVLTFLSASAQLSAQRWLDTNRPVSPVYGYRGDEFPIIASPTKWSGDTDVVVGAHDWDIWNFAHAMGFNVYHIATSSAPAETQRLDNIVNCPPELRRRGGGNEPELDTDRIILSDHPAGPGAFQAGFGRAIEFYPFDSVQSPYFVWTFERRNGGAKLHNSEEDDPTDAEHRGKAFEQVYWAANATPGDTIAWNIAYSDPNDPLNDMHFFSRSSVEARDANSGAGRTYSFVTTAHLFDSLNVANGDGTPVFRVELWQRIPRGTAFLLASVNDVRTALADTAILVDTFSVTRGELRAGGFLYPENYRTVWHTVNLRWRPIDGGPGPMNASQPGTSPRLVDARIFWTGAEKAALRSFAIRDSIGQLMLADTATAVAYRDDVLTAERRYLRGPAPANTMILDSLRHCIIGRESGTEPNWNPLEFAGFEAYDELMRDTFNLGRYRQVHGQPVRAGDSVNAWTWQAISPHDLPTSFFRLSDDHVLYDEFGYLNQTRDTVPAFLEPNYQRENRPDIVAETPFHQIPTLVEHNGGRFHLPRLYPTRDSVELYETTLQRGFVGYYHPGTLPYTWPYDRIPGAVDALGEAAAIARREGLRLMPHVGTVSAFVIRDSIAPPGVNPRDTIASHIPEPSELRMLTNLALCYGASGLWWWNLQMNPWTMVQSPTNTGVWVTPSGGGADENCCWGASGYLNRDTVPPPGTDPNDDAADRFNLRLFDASGVRTERAVVPHYYAGWRARTREIKWIDSALLGPNGVGTEMTRLRWRDAYSIAHTVRWPGLQHDSSSRPLPSNEIVTSVTSRVPGSPIADSAHRTFVELGLFHTKPGLVNGDTTVLKDTNYVFVLNRRTFERPPEHALDEVGRRMDSIAETREIRLRFHLRHPIEDTTLYRQYTFLHVQEVRPDRTPLPGATAPRRPLDTLIYGDSTAAVTLAPGRGALLRITYAPYDASIDSGDTRFNNQRKLVFDGRYYYSTYWRSGYDSLQNRWNDTVFYRRSAAVADTALGAIEWEPVEYPISAKLFPGDVTRYQNMFPSITYRVVDVPPNLHDTVVYVIWTCHVTDSINIPNRRDIALRAFRVNGPAPDWGPAEKPDVIKPDVPTQFGTPVVCALRSREVVAWSDSIRGIIVRARHDTTGPAWWRVTGRYSPLDSIGGLYTGTPLPGQYPSLPTFAHPIADTTCAIVWQQPIAPGVNQIFYSRICDRGTALPPWIMMPMTMNGPGAKYHPSVDLARDLGGDLCEGVTWEEFSGKSMRSNWLYYRSMKTWFTVNSWGTILGPPSAGASISTLIQGNGSIADSVYPNVAALNSRAGAPTRTDSTIFAIVCQTANAAMYSLRVPFDSVSRYRIGAYALSGRYPNASASRLRHDDREASLYDAYNPFGQTYSLLRTSRQFFFAKARPHGYRADGRELTLRLRDSVHAAVSVRMIDAWMSSPDTALALRMMPYSGAPCRVDSMAQVNELLRTTSFPSHDSTTIGIELQMQFLGDSTALDSARFTLIAEIVDSATGGVIAVLDSFRLERASDVLDSVFRSEHDLLSGVYFVRARIVSSNYQPVNVVNDGRFIVTEVSKDIDADLLRAGVRTVAGSGGSETRLTTQPNPFANSTEIRFSIGLAATISMRVIDGGGREIRRLLDSAPFGPGRYAVDFMRDGLPPGIYFVEMHAGPETLVRKMVLAP